MLVAVFAVVSIGAACTEGMASPARGPQADVQYYEVSCRESSTCWGAVHDACPYQYEVDERDGQQVTKGMMVDGKAFVNSHGEQTWLFHCIRRPAPQPVKADW